MGLTIRVKSSKATARPIDMGGGGFLRLRSRVAMLYGEPWASHYELLMEHPGISSDDSFFDDFSKKTEQLIREKKVSIKVVDFCLQKSIKKFCQFCFQPKSRLKGRLKTYNNTALVLSAM